MKKVGVFLLILILLTTSVSAFSLTELFSASKPKITNTQANPIKIYPGQDLQIIVSFEDDYGIEEAVAYFPYEGGYDKVEVMLIVGNKKQGTYSATWVVHDTENQKWYQTKVVLTNRYGAKAIAYVDWQDPTQSHPLDEITEGDAQFSLQKGYNFYGQGPSVVNVTSNATAGAYGIRIQHTGSGGSGLYSIATNAPAVFGWGTTGVRGQSYTSTGVGVSGDGGAYGVYGYNGGSGIAVYGWNPVVGGYAIVGNATGAGGQGGYFQGDIAVNGKKAYYETSCSVYSSLSTIGYVAPPQMDYNCPSGKTLAGGGCDCVNCTFETHYDFPVNMTTWRCHASGVVGFMVTNIICCG